MSRVRDRDTKPELALRRRLWSIGLRYRLQYRLPGRPDLTFVGARVVVFVDGCFWHGCPIHATRPATNTEFWTKRPAAENAVILSRDVEEMVTLPNIYRTSVHL